MYKTQMIIQKIVCFAVLAAAVLVFVYSLGMVTDLHYNNLTLYSEDPESFLYVEGTDIYLKIQPFNKELTAAGLYLILSALLLFIFGSHKRRRYYIGNYAATGINSALTVGVSVWGIRNVALYKEMYNDIDFERLSELQKMFSVDSKPYEPTTFWFDIGFVVFGIAIAVAVLSLISVGFKIYVMCAERKLLKEGEHE